MITWEFFWTFLKYGQQSVFQTLEKKYALSCGSIHEEIVSNYIKFAYHIAYPFLKNFWPKSLLYINFLWKISIQKGSFNIHSMHLEIFRVVTTSIARIAYISATRENVSLKSIPSTCVNPLATKQAKLCLP
jgi:hypothetical protein